MEFNLEWCPQSESNRHVQRTLDFEVNQPNDKILIYLDYPDPEIRMCKKMCKFRLKQDITKIQSLVFFPKTVQPMGSTSIIIIGPPYFPSQREKK
ncbi:hypothetical protein CRD36_00440 [Paremcibacter congregatus]|uniref:Uncharacterized protein n=1 Tax=Paremcibacter congregatus TaxID=2043170 RepID=A0A2G4YVV5_9PROT|nr:hypothetical protein CRD36_00440 [Paremcibacter congregatus]